MNWPAFWTGFREGYIIGLKCGLAFFAGGMFVLFLEYNDPHPYDQCAIKYQDPTDISECIWLLVNP